MLTVLTHADKHRLQILYGCLTLTIQTTSLSMHNQLDTEIHADEFKKS